MVFKTSRLPKNYYKTLRMYIKQLNEHRQNDQSSLEVKQKT